MIRPPRRSVTRFFIPMIDVLTLLFCIFLLMPFVKSAGEEGAEGGPAAAPAADVVVDPAEVVRRLQEAEKEIERLRKERGDVASRLDVRTLEIDKDTGDLLYYDPQPLKLSTKDDAARLIARHRDESHKAGRELYYLFLYPRDPESAGLPRRAQEEAYKEWFKDVPYGIDNPRAPR
jgi:hypothetical protein